MLLGYNWAKAKHLCGRVWLPLRGIRPPRRALAFVCLLLGACLASDCASTGESDDEDTDAASQASGSDGNKKTSGPAHPAAASAWDTQVLLMTHPQPPIEELQTCQMELIAAAKEANQETDILEAKEQFVGHVKTYPELYHWCFYNAMFALDTSINQNGMTLTDRNAMFLDTMKQLWILARALDRVYKGSPYFLYLQSRYVDISQAVFGRQLSIIGLPLGGLPPPPQSQKPLGEAPVDEE